VTQTESLELSPNIGYLQITLTQS